jgi:hypothetical protein
VFQPLNDETALRAFAGARGAKEKNNQPQL